MFISKKKFKEAIEKAKFETEEKMWERKRLNDLEEILHNRINALESRIAVLEGSANTPKEFRPFTDTHPNCKCVLTVRPRM